MAIFYWLLYGLKWKYWRDYNFCCNLFWVYGPIDWTIMYVIKVITNKAVAINYFNNHRFMLVTYQKHISW